jgi:hypothetical protein
MIKKLTKIFLLLKHLEKIKAGIIYVYYALDNVVETLKFIEQEQNNTKYGKKVKLYLPNTIIILSKIKQIIEKYGPVVGVKISNVTALGTERQDFIQESEMYIKNLNDLLE